MKLSGVFEPDEVIILLTVPTGVAAFNIGGMTLHSALMLGCNKYATNSPYIAHMLHKFDDDGILLENICVDQSQWSIMQVIFYI